MLTHFVSAAGMYLVMSKLSMNEIHASTTIGNAPNVDILACSADGAKSIAIQVKTATSARREKGRGEERKFHFLDFDIGYNSAKLNSNNLFFALVDLDQEWDKVPIIYIVPSKEIYEYCKEWVDDVPRVRFQPEISRLDKYKENWNLIKEALLSKE